MPLASLFLRRALCLCLLACAPFAAPSIAAPWESRGIGGGGALYSPAFSPHAVGDVFMATDMTAVFRTGDGGASWQKLPFTELRGGVETTVQFTSDPDIFYAVDIGDWQAPRSPVKTTDGGASFAVLPGDPTGGETFRLFADPVGTERLMVNDWLRVYFSGNGGGTFSEAFVTNDTGSGMHLAGVVWDGQRIVVGTNHGVLESTDGGASFAPVATPGFPSGWAMVQLTGAREGSTLLVYAVAFPAADVWGGIDPNRFASAAARLYRVDWGLGAWELVHDHASGDDPSYYFVDCAENDIHTIYLAGHSNWHPSVLKSVDSGDTWTDVLLTADNQNVATGWMGDGGDVSWYWAGNALGFAVSPTDPNRAMVTDYGFVHMTEDGGASWRQAYVQPDDQNPAGAPTPTGGAYRSAGVEQTSAWQLHWVDDAILIACFSDFRGTRSTDGGVSWTAGSALGLPHNTTYRVVEGAGGRLFAATSSVHDMYQSTYLTDARIDPGLGHVMTSVDGGAHWGLARDLGHPVVWLSADPADPETIYASVVDSQDGGIYVTHNASSGADFAPLPAPPRTEGHPYNIRILDDGTLVTSWSGRIDPAGNFTESSGVFVSTDGGASWGDRSADAMRRWTMDVVIDPHDAAQDTWYAAVFSHWGHFPNELGGLYRTTNRGLVWTQVSDLYRVESVAIDPTNPDRAWVSTETEGLWVTQDLGSPTPTFAQDATYPFQHPVRLFFSPHDIYELWCTSFGGGLYVTNLNAVAVDVPGAAPASHFTVSPNPGRLPVALTFALSRSQPVSLAVYDVGGRRVATLLEGVMGPGAQRTVWNGRNSRLAAGTYFVRLEAGEDRQVRKLQLVH